MPGMNPRLLLVEDDEVSRAFLTEVLSGLPAHVDAVAGIARACELAASITHDVWIVDAHLPDGDGVQALKRLRDLHAETPALAITAEDDRVVLDALCSAGFLEVLQKPVGIAPLQAAVRRALGQRTAEPAAPFGKLPAWDEEQALRAIGGRRESLLALRSLFLGELPSQRDAALAAAGADDAIALRGILHRLRASAGFVGALRLLRAVEAWAQAPSDPRKRLEFEFAVSDQLAAADATRDPAA